MNEHIKAALREMGVNLEYDPRNLIAPLVIHEQTKPLIRLWNAALEEAAKAKVPFPKISSAIQQELFEAGLDAKTKAVLALKITEGE